MRCRLSDWKLRAYSVKDRYQIAFIAIIERNKLEMGQVSKEAKEILMLLHIYTIFMCYRFLRKQTIVAVAVIGSRGCLSYSD